MNPVYRADPSLKGKLRRRLARLTHRRPARLSLDGPVISFTFDDAPESAAEAGAGILEAAGARGTYYLCAGLFGREGPMGRFADADQATRLADTGHEIACHTFSHLDCGRADAATIALDADRNADALAEVARTPRHFAYPYGDVSTAAKTALKGRYGSLRGLHKGLVRDGADLTLLPAVGIEGEDGEAIAARWIDRAAAENAWLILYTHDVLEAPSPFGCTPGALERLVARAQAAGARIDTVGGALDRARPR